VSQGHESLKRAPQVLDRKLFPTDKKTRVLPLYLLFNCSGLVVMEDYCGIGEMVGAIG
jgi:hypothetical protein